MLLCFCNRIVIKMRGLGRIKRSGGGQSYLIKGLKNVTWIILLTGIDYSRFLEEYRPKEIVKNLLKLDFVGGFMLTATL